MALIQLPSFSDPGQPCAVDPDAVVALKPMADIDSEGSVRHFSVLSLENGDQVEVDLAGQKCLDELQFAIDDEAEL